jgi:glycerophosphoryl diester phosphodiesterase
MLVAAESDTGLETGPAGPSPLVVAHRGASRAFPENTLAAFEGASRLGADWVELDVRRTADRQVVVHHDATIADQPIVVLARTALPAAVPSLAQVLEVCRRADPPLGVNIEIKSDPREPDFDADHWIADEVVSIVGVHPDDEVLVSSFDRRAVDRVHQLDPRLPTALLAVEASDIARLVAQVVEWGHVAINPSRWLVDEAFVVTAHAAGLAVNVWTVDDTETMTRLADWGVDAIITNVPDVARSLWDGP